jgi:prepilin-type N-terminal cleavage/methylation domain-containing protein
MKRKLGKKLIWSGNRGYTLIELAVAMAVLGILIAVSIPSAQSLINSYRIRRLDMQAQTLLLAAQNRLAELKAKGGLDACRPVRGRG